MQIANERTNGNNDKRWRNRAKQSATVYLIAGGRAGGIGCSDGGEIAGVSVRQTLDGHERQPRPLGWSFMGWRQACVASRNGDNRMLGILVE